MTHDERHSRNMWHAFWERDKGTEALGDELDDLVALWLRAKGRLRVVLMECTYSDPLGPYWSEG